MCSAFGAFAGASHRPKTRASRGLQPIRGAQRRRQRLAPGLAHQHAETHHSAGFSARQRAALRLLAHGRYGDPPHQRQPPNRPEQLVFCPRRRAPASSTAPPWCCSGCHWNRRRSAPPAPAAGVPLAITSTTPARQKAGTRGDKAPALACRPTGPSTSWQGPARAPWAGPGRGKLPPVGFAKKCKHAKCKTVLGKF